MGEFYARDIFPAVKTFCKIPVCIFTKHACCLWSYIPHVFFYRVGARPERTEIVELVSSSVQLPMEQVIKPHSCNMRLMIILKDVLFSPV